MVKLVGVLWFHCQAAKKGGTHMAMGQKPVPVINGCCTYPKMVPLVLTHSHIYLLLRFVKLLAFVIYFYNTPLVSLFTDKLVVSFI